MTTPPPIQIAELKVQVVQSSPTQETFDPTEANRLCEMVASVYAERGRLRKHMADLDAKEREALLKVCRKVRSTCTVDSLYSLTTLGGPVRVS